MNWKIFFQRGLIACLVAIFALGAVIVGAAIKTFNGTGKYIMSDFENQEIAQQRAIQRAKEDAQDKAGVYLTNFSKSVNANLVADEISAVTNNILEIFDVDVQAEPFEVKGEPGIIWTATLKANIDPDGIFEYMKRDDKEKVKIVQQNTQLQDAIAKNDKEIEDLKEKYNRATSQEEKNRIREQMKQADRDFLANQKLKEANKLYYDKNYEGSIKIYNEAIELKPNYTMAYNNRGACYNVLGQNKRAIQDYDKTIELNPNDAAAYNNRGNAYKDLGQNERAIKDYDKSIELNTNHYKPYNNRGTAYINLGQNERAIKDFDKSITLNPNYYEAYYNRGLAYAYLGQYERAIKDFDKSIALNQNYAEAYTNRGTAYAYLGQYERAIQDFDKAIALNPNLAVAYVNRGAAYSDLGQYERAIQDFDKVIALNPNNDGAYNNRGWAYYCLKQYQQALKDFEKTLELNPNNTRAKNNREACLKAMSK